jgi:hypothetical protein
MHYMYSRVALQYRCGTGQAAGGITPCSNSWSGRLEAVLKLKLWPLKIKD